MGLRSYLFAESGQGWEQLLEANNSIPLLWLATVPLDAIDHRLDGVGPSLRLTNGESAGITLGSAEALEQLARRRASLLPCSVAFRRVWRSRGGARNRVLAACRITGSTGPTSSTSCDSNAGSARKLTSMDYPSQSSRGALEQLDAKSLPLRSFPEWGKTFLPLLLPQQF